MFFSIGNKNINKGTALQWLCNHLNIATKNSIGIGDNYNDISMLETVGYPVVMDNAVMTLKTKNYYLTTSNNDSGVAKAIAYYFPLPFQLNN